MALAEKSETLNSDNQDLLVVYGFLHLNITFSQIPSLDSPGNSCSSHVWKELGQEICRGGGGILSCNFNFFSRSVHNESQLASRWEILMIMMRMNFAKYPLMRFSLSELQPNLIEIRMIFVTLRNSDCRFFIRPVYK